MESRLREPEDYDWGRGITDAILVIEAEASAPSPEMLALVEGVLERHRRTPPHMTDACLYDRKPWPCPDRQAAENWLAKAEAGRTEGPEYGLDNTRSKGIIAPVR
jgi:hypothetical protein